MGREGLEGIKVSTEGSMVFWSKVSPLVALVQAAENPKSKVLSIT